MSQTAFRTAVLNADRPAPETLIGPTGAPAGKRFDVYRNNVAVSLTEALRTAFPIIRKLVGDQFFDAMAGVYLRQHPPTSPLMMHYGQDMPHFLRHFGPVKHLGYLPDMAKLELAVRASYHAADVVPMQTADLQNMPPEIMSAATFQIAPAIQVIESRHPLYGIWAMNSLPDAPKPGTKSQHVLISRPGFDPMVDPLTPDSSRFVQNLIKGKSLGLALTAAPDGFDPAPALGLLLSRHAIVKAET